VLAFLACATPGYAQESGVTLIKNATVLTITHGTIEHGSVLIRDGKIADIGTSIAAPAGATVIDATGQYVMPGIIDCHSHIAIEGGVNEGSVSVSSMANIADVINPNDPDIYRDLSGGVTVANVLHGSANSIGGQTEVIKLRWGLPADSSSLKARCPASSSRSAKTRSARIRRRFPDSRAVYPATRLGVEATIRQAFTDAKAYKAEWDDYNRRKAAGDQNLIPPRRDVTLDPLVEVLEGKRYVHAHSLPRRRNPDAASRGQGVRLQSANLPARSRGLQSRR